ncbi:MAG: hypothetical protein AAGA76_12410 [Pseudomonadota bacterium]
MLGEKTKIALGLIATAGIGIFVFALAESISSGFAGFYGGLPFWVIVIFVMGLATYDFLTDCLNISENTKFFLQLVAIVFCGTAFTYAGWGTSTLFAEKDEIFVRSSFFGNYTSPAIWYEVFWMVFAFFAAALTFVLVMRKIAKRDQQTTG